MKSIILTLLLALAASPAVFAAAVAAPETPAILTDNTGNDTRTMPLPVVDGGAATTTAAISALAAQQASESLSALAAQASTTGELQDLAAQQASEALAIQAAQATTTTAVDNLKASATILLGALATPTMTQLTATTPAASHVPAAKRQYVVIHNLDGAETVYVNPAGTAVAGGHIPIYPGSTILRPWGPTVTISYVASTASEILIEEATLP